MVYTDQLPTYADPILDRLDPQRFIQYRLYRDSTQYINGKHVRLWPRHMYYLFLLLPPPPDFSYQARHAIYTAAKAAL